MIVDLLYEKLPCSSSCECKLNPDDPEYDITLIFLEELKGKDHYNLYPDLECEVSGLIEVWNLPSVKKCIDAGFKLPQKILFDLHSIRGNTVDIIKLLIENGYDMSDEGYSVAELMGQK